jgi:hypothetical protein
MSWIHMAADFNPLHHPFPWIVSIGNVTSVFFTRRGKIIGWWILAVTQLIFIIHSITTPTDTGFIIGNISMLLVSLDSVRLWSHRKDGRVPDHLREQLPAAGQVRHVSAVVVPPVSEYPAPR